MNEEKNIEIVVDTITCPHCGSQMVRSGMDDPSSLCDRHYICEVCGADETVNGEVI